MVYQRFPVEKIYRNIYFVKIEILKSVLKIYNYHLQLKKEKKKKLELMFMKNF